MSKVLTNWNSFDYVERYAYWNSEADCSKLYKYGKEGNPSEISILGKWYGEMKSGMGYKKSYDYVPKVVYSTPSGMSLEYTERTRKLAKLIPEGE